MSSFILSFKSADEENVVKTRILICNIMADAVSFYLENGCQKKDDETWFNFTEKIRTSVNKSKLFGFSKDQEETIKANVNCRSFDITLLTCLIRGLRDANSLKNCDSPLHEVVQNDVIKIKKERNKLSHENRESLIMYYGDGERMKEIEKIGYSIIENSAKLFQVQCKAEEIVKEMKAKIEELFSTRLLIKDMTNMLSYFVDELKVAYVTNEQVVPLQFTIFGNVSVQIHEVFGQLIIKNIYLDNDDDDDVCYYSYDEVLSLFEKEKARFIILEGPGGAGKTMLTQKLIYEWIKGENVFQGISSYRFIFYLQFRERGIKTLSELFTLLFPQVRNQTDFHINDFCSFLNTNEKTLFILDGFDEINEDTKSIFVEILTKFKSSHFFITGRPESISQLQSLLPQYSKRKRLYLGGIPINRQNEFINRYLNVLNVQNGLSTEDFICTIEKLSKDIKELLELPLNMVYIIYLYVNLKLDANIEVPSDLMEQLESCSLDKMVIRLLLNPKCEEKNERRLRKKCKKVLEKLEEVAFLCLKKDQLSLDDESVDKIEAVCQEEKIPAEELESSFLRLKPKSLSRSDAVLTFPHKSSQEFRASKFVFRQIKNNTKSTVHDGIDSTVHNKTDFTVHDNCTPVVKLEEILGINNLGVDNKKFFNFLLFVLNQLTRPDEENREELIKLYGKNITQICLSDSIYEMNIVHAVHKNSRFSSQILQQICSKVKPNNWQVVDFETITALELLGFVKPPEVVKIVIQSKDSIDKIRKFIEKLPKKCLIKLNDQQNLISYDSFKSRPLVRTTSV